MASVGNIPWFVHHSDSPALSNCSFSFRMRGNVTSNCMKKSSSLTLHGSPTLPAYILDHYPVCKKKKEMQVSEVCDTTTPPTPVLFFHWGVVVNNCKGLTSSILLEMQLRSWEWTNLKLRKKNVLRCVSHGNCPTYMSDVCDHPQVSGKQSVVREEADLVYGQK